MVVSELAQVKFWNLFPTDCTTSRSRYSCMKREESVLNPPSTYLMHAMTCWVFESSLACSTNSFIVGRNISSHLLNSLCSSSIDFVDGFWGRAFCHLFAHIFQVYLMDRFRLQVFVGQATIQTHDSGNFVPRICCETCWRIGGFFILLDCMPDAGVLFWFFSFLCCCLLPCIWWRERRWRCIQICYKLCLAIISPCGELV